MSANFTIAAIIIAVAAAYYNTSSAWTAALAGVAVIAIAAVVSVDLYKATMNVVIHGVRAARDIVIVGKKASVAIYTQNQMTERERIKAQRAIATHQAKSQHWVVKTAAQTNQARLRTERKLLQQQEAQPQMEFDEWLDAEYEIVEE